MKYDLEFLNLHTILVNNYLINVESNILDISYSFEEKNVTIQVVLNDNTNNLSCLSEKLIKSYPEYNFAFKYIYLTTEKYNDFINGWSPKYYTWMDVVLLSKAELK